jgi:hypothetical protein
MIHNQGRLCNSPSVPNGLVGGIDINGPDSLAASGVKTTQTALAAHGIYPVILNSWSTSGIAIGPLAIHIETGDYVERIFPAHDENLITGKNGGTPSFSNPINLEDFCRAFRGPLLQKSGLAEYTGRIFTSP